MSDTASRLNAALEGRYTIESELGEGGMATVYLATDLKHNRKVALKVLKPELAAVVGAERFLAEIETTANLQHPNILPLFDSGEADSFLYYVMPFVEGESLAARLKREGELSVKEAVRLTSAVALALGYAHRQGVIHRDIKPENILLQDGQPVVADFGIALAVSAAGGGRMTETGMSLGTPHYMSPEQATADRVPGPGADIYSLGCVLYEMLTGEPPYTGSSAQAILGKIITAEPDLPTKHRASVPANVESVILRALEKVPSDRFETAEELGQALENEAFRHDWGGVSATATGHSGWRQAAIAMSAVSVVLAAFLVQAALVPEPDLSGQVFSINLDQQPSGGLALSPDGTKLVYRDTANVIWLRDLSEIEETRVSDLDTGGRPVFSPSSEELLLYSPVTSSMEIVSLDGQHRRALADDVWNNGPSFSNAWTTDDQIVFTDILGVRSIDASTGEIVTINEADRSSGEMFERASALPTSEYILVQRDRLNVNSIGRMRLSDGSFEEIVAGEAPRFAGGFLFFVDVGGALQAAPYDPRGSELSGRAIPLISGLHYESGFRRFSYDVSETGVLVYQLQSELPALPEIVQVAQDGTERSLDLHLPEGTAPELVALSPDRRKIAVGTADEIWVQDAAGGEARRLGRAGDTISGPRWSLDGSDVYYIIAGVDGGNGDIFRQRADLSRPQQLVFGGERGVFDFALHPGGDTLALMLEDGNEDGDLAWVDLASGSDPVLLDNAGTGDEHSLSLSPNGKWLAYQTNDGGQVFEVYVIDFPEGRSRVQVSVDGGHSPRWSRDGSEIFYVDHDDFVWSVAVSADSAFESLERIPLYSAERFAGGLTWLYRTPYSHGPQDGSLLFADAELPGPGETFVVLNVFEELRRRAAEGN